MTYGLTLYPGYKASGVEWLGEVPEHWDLKRTKSLLAQRSEKGFPNEPLLAATQTKGVVRKENYEHRTVLAMKDLELLKIVHVGDFVISLRSFQGGIEFARERGIISPAYTILYPLEKDHHAYLALVFKSRPYLENLSLFVTGIRQGQNIDYERLARSYLPLPPRNEQSAIVSFLNHTDRRIQRYIQIKKKHLQLLEEQKHAIIHQAVTGQFNVRTGKPYPTYKPSGVEWLGDLPQHWEVDRAEHRLEYTKNLVPAHELNGRQVLHYSIPNVQQFGTGVVESGASIDADKQLVDRKVLLVSKLNPRKGTVTLAKPSSELTTLASTEFIAMEPKGCMAEFALFLFTSEIVRRELSSRVDSATNSHQRCSPADITKLRIPWPPLTEQTNIVRFLNDSTANLENAVEHTRRQIDLIQEYRTCLISDVVTGKLDVREAAANLPNETESMDNPSEPDSINAGVSQDVA